MERSSVVNSGPGSYSSLLRDNMIRRTKILLAVLCTITIFVLVSVTRTQQQQQQQAFGLVDHATASNGKPVAEKFVLLHLDLKGAPPKMEFLLELLPLAQRAGANGLLIEYEDSFPWSGALRNISAGNSYTVEEVNALQQLAEKLGIEVIPLVQTFGHLEFVLKLAEFRHLRELDTFPQEVCPSKPDTYQLIKELIRQVMVVHRKARYLHIGCDEVYHLAACSVCSKHNHRAIFAKHVKRVAEHVRGTYAGVTPIIWDDMLRHWSPIDIEESGLGELVEPMVWVYIDDIPRLVPHFIWFVYKKTFQNLWAASAYKGAFGEKQAMPDLSRHVDNTRAWLRLMQFKPTENTITVAHDFRGIALTGWSRYDHFAVLAELLPAAVPSLILNLALVHAHFHAQPENQAYENMINVLQCPSPFPFHSTDEMRIDRTPWIFNHCSFPGRIIHQLVCNYVGIESRFELVMKQYQANGWVTEYNIKYGYSSPHRVLELFPGEGFAAQNLLKSVQLFKADAMADLKTIYDDSVAEEWIEYKIQPIEQRLLQMEQAFQRLIQRKTWPKRPIRSD